MKYMILSYASQLDYDAMSGKDPDLNPADFVPLYEFMATFNQRLVDSGELVETRALAAPVHTRRLRAGDGVVTDGPYAETQEVLAGYWIVECDSFDRATEIAAALNDAPAPPAVAARGMADVRPIVESAAELAF